MSPPMSDETDDSPAIRITVQMHLAQIDLDTTDPVPVEKLVESLKRYGVTHMQCVESRGRQVEGGFDEELVFDLDMPNRETVAGQDG